jgi:hypothetical protein
MAAGADQTHAMVAIEPLRMQSPWLFDQLSALIMAGNTERALKVMITVPPATSGLFIAFIVMVVVLSIALPVIITLATR